MKTSTVAAWTGISLATGLLGYCVYFDYKRRNDPVFRKKLQKEHRKLNKLSQQASQRDKAATRDAIKRALREIEGDVSKIREFSVEARQEEFYKLVTEAEILTQRGPSLYLEVAKKLYTALRFYEQPSQLVMIYQSTQPAPVFALIMEFMSIDMAEPSAASTSRGPRNPPGPSGDALLEEIVVGAVESNAGASSSSSAPADPPEVVAEPKPEVSTTETAPASIPESTASTAPVPPTATSEEPFPVPVETVEPVTTTTAPPSESGSSSFTSSAPLTPPEIISHNEEAPSEGAEAASDVHVSPAHSTSSVTDRANGASYVDVQRADGSEA